MKAGLFGFTKGATFKNLSVYGSVTGKGNTGGICGTAEYYRIGSTYYYSSFSNCHNYCTVSGSTVYGSYVGGISGYMNGTATGCSNHGKVIGDEYVGGLFGNVLGAASKCRNIARVSGNKIVGGICGSGGVNNSGNSGNIVAKNSVGGIVGSGAVSNSVNSGSVRATGTSGSSDLCYAGGISGSSGTIRNCLNTGSVSGVKYAVGALIGYLQTYNAVYNSYYRKGCAVNGNGNTQGENGYMDDSSSGDHGLTSDQLRNNATIESISIETCTETPATYTDYSNKTLTEALNLGVNQFNGSAIAGSNVFVPWIHSLGSYPDINF